MSGVMSCKQCGCSEIDTDPARGDAVCTNCGFVLEESLIVSEVTFEEDGHGGASAVGQFVSAESRGGGILSTASGGFHSGVGKESRELTLRNAKKKIVEVAQQLRLNQHCIDVAFNFFKMALHKQLTKGRKNSLTIAACIYMTCRIEGTPHLLIDFSDVLQMDVYALGRAYCQIARSLFISIPAVDPCMYILRFAHKFDLGDKTHEVAMTSLRLVQRMKRDWIHLGRRPSGLCGAALLISARLHNFSRSVQDVIRVVKVHETTLRKRLVEFGETPSSSLTLDEFMSVDLEEEHDPPSFKAARIKDRERLQKLLDEEVCEEFKTIQGKIEEELGKRRKRAVTKAEEASLELESSDSSSSVTEVSDAKKFVMESTLETISTLISSGQEKKPLYPTNSASLCTLEESQNESRDLDRILMPPPPSSSCVSHDDIAGEISLESHNEVPTHTICDKEDGELDLDGIDDEEIDFYIMNKKEVKRKTVLWEKLNAEYITQQKIKQEQLEKDIKEGKLDTKKKKKAPKVKPTFQAKSANEAIKIMLKERKMSSKINYDVLRSLTGADVGDEAASTSETTDIEPVTVIESGPIIPPGRGGSKRPAETPVEPTPSGSKRSRSRARKQSISDFKDHVELETNAEVQEEASAVVEPEPEETEAEVVEVEPAHDEVIVESGPVIATEEAVVEESGNIYYIEDDADEEDEEEDEDSLSARKLLTQFRGGEEEAEDDDYYE